MIRKPQDRTDQIFNIKQSFVAYFQALAVFLAFSFGAVLPAAAAIQDLGVDRGNWLSDDNFPIPKKIEKAFEGYEKRGMEFYLERYNNWSAAEFCALTSVEQETAMIVSSNSDAYDLMLKLRGHFATCPDKDPQQEIFWQAMDLVEKSYQSNDTVVRYDAEFDALQKRAKTDVEKYTVDLMKMHLHIRNIEYMTAINVGSRLEFMSRRVDIPTHLRLSNDWSMAYLFVEVIDIAQSTIFYEKSFNLAREAGELYPMDISTTYYNLAIGMRYLYDLPEEQDKLIVDIFETLDRYYRKSGLMTEVYYTAFGLASYHMKNKQYSKCIPLLQASLKEHGSYMDETYKVFSKELLALCLLKDGQTEKAGNLFEDVLNQSKQIYRQHNAEQSAWFDLLEAEMKYARGEYKEAYKKLGDYADNNISFLQKQSADQIRRQQVLNIQMLQKFSNQEILEEAGIRQRRIVVSASIVIVVLLLVGIGLLALKNRQLRESESRAMEASVAKSHFIANMSHELRTPLNAIIGFSEMTYQETFGEVGHPKYKEYAAMIHDSGHHLLDVISEILDLSKVESGKLVLELSDIDLVATAQQISDLMVNNLASKKHKFILKAPDTLPPLVADERLVKQILLNLLSNANKFTANGGTIELDLSYTEGEGHKIAVKDSGIGMSEEQIELALEPFGQVQGVYGRSHQGTGLGLPLVKKFVELHGGDLTLNSTPGVGTTVIAIFPTKTEE